ncbi:hypothetical protein GYMLUDRAFT_163432 [Collybiopsis luxurians FD-317 M1]|uniref:Uncharacterized protein n=1 Tax=Collybiopsis luxurians FD-317 M1 TaxID=944289 RepID=A0A0D0C4L4_9AGAR|nr:hypothetical protein GYMLUDRAFT_163432 [Collybiopsis luxurians FD-317 M1]
MEVKFDNGGNILNANLLATHDSSPIYVAKTNFSFLGREITFLKDSNPAGGSGSVTVGAIHWRDKAIEVHGHKKKIADLKTKKGGIVNKVLHKERYWRWAKERKEYAVQYSGNDEWTVRLVFDGTRKVAARFATPYRPHLFTKSKPPLLSLTRTALAEDEIFLLLLLIYSEARRQDDTVSAQLFGVSSRFHCVAEFFCRKRLGRLVIPSRILYLRVYCISSTACQHDGESSQAAALRCVTP